MAQVETLRDILATLRERNQREAIYLPPGAWTLETRAMVLDPDTAEPEEEDPREAREVGFSYALQVQDARGVRNNLEAQRSGSSDDLDLLLRAFAYYVRHDAFMRLA